MISKDTVRDLVLAATVNTGIFVVNVKVGSLNRISIEVDKPEGITIEECVDISRVVEAGLDRETEDFDLEVSSPGLGEPFRVIEQYRKNCGKQVNVTTQDGQKFTGTMKHVYSDSIILEAEIKIKAGKRFKTEVQSVTLKFNDIKATKLIIAFK